MNGHTTIMHPMMSSARASQLIVRSNRRSGLDAAGDGGAGFGATTVGSGSNGAGAGEGVDVIVVAASGVFI
jgi:hypothetical protein